MTPRRSAGSIRAVRPVVAVLAAALVAVASLASPPAGATTGAPAPVRPSAATVQQGEPRGEPVDQQLPIPEPSTDEADQRADEILDDPKFDEPPKGIVERIFEWIAEQLDKIPFPDLGAPGSGGGQVLGYVFLFLLAVLAIFMLSKTRLSGRRRRDEPDFIVASEEARPQHEWIGEAERYEAEGQWKQALRCRFRALVSALIERGVVRDIPGRTTGEYRVEVSRNAGAIAAPFADAAELFDRAWYGDEPTGAAENQRFRALADEVLLGLEADAARLEAPVGAGSFEAPS